MQGAVWTTEIDGNADVRCQFAVPAHLAALVIGHSLAQLRDNFVEGGRKAGRRSADIGVPTEFGKNSTLRLLPRPQWPKLPVVDLAILVPDVIAG
jgi:hypothetical protein